MNDYNLLDLFHQEMEHQVSILKESLIALNKQPFSIVDLEQATQAAHSIWGSARLVSREKAADLAQVMKECLIAAQNKTVTLGDEQLDILLHASDLLLSMGTKDTEYERWMSEHSWELATTQKAISIIVTSGVTSAPSPNQPNIPSVPEPVSELPLPKPPTPIPTISADSSMVDLFRLEVEAQVGIMNDNLLALEVNPQSAPALENLMRAAHSIKGSARIVAFDTVVGLAHVMEDCFVAAQNKTITLSSAQVDILLQGVDLLQGISSTSNEELPNWLTENHAAFAGVQSAVAAILNPIDEGPIPPTPFPMREGGEIQQQDKEIQQQNQQIQQQDKEIQQQDKEIQQQNQQTQQQDKETQQQNQQTQQQDKETQQQERERESKPLSSQERGLERGQDRVVRVSAENLNRIMGLAGESLIEANWLQPHADSMMSLKWNLVDLSRTLEQLQDALDRGNNTLDVKQYLEEARHKEQACIDLLSDRLYREVITSNMRPFADGVQGFPRMIRDLARKLNKQVKLDIIGKSTSVDRDILKKLEAPLTHILRNATDHGIEMPSERIEKGKPPEGTIRLEAFHRGGMLAISISDDGRGMDLEQLRQKVINKNLATKEMAAQFSDAELMEFIFLPGFSTAKQVTEISGRGVGLDIAKSMAQEVGGTVRAVSQPGKGMSFHFQLPLTLSVVRTLLVEISGRPYAVPLARIEQIITVDEESICDVENRQYFTMNQQNIGLIAAEQVLELPPGEPKTGAMSVVVISDQSNTYGLVVDKFLGERDLVVRPLDPRLGKVRDISATSLLEDGSPVLIVDVSDMVRTIDGILNAGRITKVGSQSVEEVVIKRKKILVVDDSITVREMERKLLENRGYSVDIAVNGVEGWNAVRANHYNLVISDIDMPRMNGIELVQHIKSHPRLNSLPVIIMSYRDRQEDRIQGLEAGADYYLTKSSFHDDTLIEAVVNLIGR